MNLRDVTYGELMQRELPARTSLLERLSTDESRLFMAGCLYYERRDPARLEQTSVAALVEEGRGLRDRLRAGRPTLSAITPQQAKPPASYGDTGSFDLQEQPATT